MDFEAPPPFTGALEEPPDVECDIRMTVDDEDEDELPDIPSDLPITFPPAASPPTISFEKPKSSEVVSPSDSYPSTANFPPFPIANGLPETIDVPTVTGHDNYPEANTSHVFTSASQAAECDHRRDDVCTDEVSWCGPNVPDEGHFCEQNIPHKPTSSAHSCISEDDDFDDFGDFACVKGEDAETEEAGSSNKVEPEKMKSDSKTSVQRNQEKDHVRREFKPYCFQNSQTNYDGEQIAEPNGLSAEAKPRDDDEWSADFAFCGEISVGEGSRETINSKTADVSSSAESCPILDELCDCSNLWDVENEIGNDEAYDISAMLDADKPVILKNEKNESASLDRSFHLWFALRIVEDALALKFEWKNAEHGENLYKALAIDPKAVGRGSLPPLSSGTVLEPTPFIANGTARRSVIISREGAHDAKVFRSESTINALQSRNLSTAAESPSIPQADFDWDKSGLTNPTKASNRSSALLDVDFLSANSGSGSSSTISTLQKELDQLGLSNSSSQMLKKPSSQP
ncbi:hypothetical protein NECAME_02251 [Necator americanus]|uniref:Aftiphilin clathrin-binding box domain-containing protein n=1 Tax=Necator americanus TaxID=51031 RepID=W2TIL3_NECAM|nr:hypothetical protein NECAME_02251 [Necator americanus]ETN80852.1 hypothetical protein NECAME_02251 [Necator americanus]